MNDTDPPAEAAADDRGTYLAHKQQLDQIKQENERTLARNTLIIAGGAFTLSVTLLKDLYPNPLPWSKWVLILSWAVFGLCAFLQIYADHLSSKAVEVELDKLEDYFQNDIPEARNEMEVYAWWWTTQGRDDLAERAATMAKQLEAFEPQPPTVIPEP